MSICNLEEGGKQHVLKQTKNYNFLLTAIQSSCTLLQIRNEKNMLEII